MNLYPVDKAIGFSYTYLLGSDLSVGWHYPMSEQLEPEPFVVVPNFIFHIFKVVML